MRIVAAEEVILARWKALQQQKVFSREFGKQ